MAGFGLVNTVHPKTRKSNVVISVGVTPAMQQTKHATCYLNAAWGSIPASQLFPEQTKNQSRRLGENQRVNVRVCCDAAYEMTCPCHERGSVRVCLRVCVTS